MAWILIVFLIFLGGLIAPFGDILGTKIGKARFSILKLRPKKTATIITIITGGFISSISIGLLILVSEEFRQRLFVDIPFLQKTLDESKKALLPLQEERKRLEDKINNPIDIELINPPVIIVIIVAVFFGLNLKILNLALPIFVPRISPNGAINPPSNIKKAIKIQATLLHIFSTS